MKMSPISRYAIQYYLIRHLDRHESIANIKIRLFITMIRRLNRHDNVANVDIRPFIPILSGALIAFEDIAILGNAYSLKMS